MQSVLSWISTRIAVSISYDDNHYTTGTSFFTNPSARAVIVLVISCFLACLWGSPSLGRDSSRRHVKTRNVSASNRPLAVIDERKLQLKICGSGRRIEKRKKMNWSPDVKRWWQNLKQARARRTIENEKDSIKVCVCSPFFSWRFISLCLNRSTQFIFYFSLLDDF